MSYKRLKGMLLFILLLLMSWIPLLAYQTELISYQSYITLREHRSKATALAFNYEGNILASADDKGLIILWNLQQKKSINHLIGHKKRVNSLSFSRDGNYLISGDDDQKIIIWNLQSGSKKVIKSGHGKVFAVALNPDGSSFATAGDSKKIYLRNVNTGEEIATLYKQGHKKKIIFLSYGGKGKTLISIGEDKAIITWDLLTKNILRYTGERSSIVKSANVDSTHAFLALGATDTSLYRGALISNRNISPHDLKYSSKIKIIDMKTNAITKTITCQGVSEISSISISADNKYIATVSPDKTLRVWDIKRGVEVITIPLRNDTNSIAFSPNGEWLTAAENSGEIPIWKMSGIIPSKEYLANLMGRKYIITSSKTPLITFKQKKVLAFLDLDDLGVESQVAKTISDLIRSKLAESDKITLIERSQIDKILQEIEFQMSGMTDEKFAVKIGQMLNVEKMIMGSVSKLGTSIIITVKMVDVTTGKIEGSRNLQCNQCELEELPEAVNYLMEVMI